MNRVPLKQTIKELSDKLIRLNRYSPEQLDRLLNVKKIDAISDSVDHLAIDFDNRLLALEAKIDKQAKGKKNVKEN